MGQINIENQRQIMDGMIDAIKETKDNIYIFTNRSNKQNNREDVQGAFQIMELPDFKYFDGAIVALNTITYAPAASYVLDQLRSNSVPFVTLNRAVEGHACLESSNFEAQYKIVEHMIKDHGYKKIFYVRGPEGNSQAEERFEAYKKALEDYSIPFDPQNVYTGHFTLESGVQAGMQIYKDGMKAEAIICANDNMAVGVLEFFKMVGIHVPDDIKLAAFDNSDTARYSNPPITSIDKNPHELGYRSIKEIISVLDGNEPQGCKIPVEVSRRESCGCKDAYTVDVDELKYKYMQMDIYNEHLAEMINGNMSDFSGLQSPEEVIPILSRSIHRIGLKRFYLCLCEKDKVYALPESNMGGDIDLMQVNRDYTKLIDIPLAYEDGKLTAYKPFPKGMVLPEEVRSKDEGGSYYVVTPVFFQNCCYGYAVSGNDKLALKNTLYYSWLSNIGVAYENIRKRMLLQDAVIRLNNVWSYDMLTQLYNRAGFYYEAKTILELLKMQDSKIFVLFSDVDGLKKVNDNQGHEAGDMLIKEMAACFKENLTDDMLAMRYGGDEFVVFGSYEEEADITRFLEGIQASMDRRNASGKNTFKLAISIGVTKYNAVDVNELSEIIDIADANMYEQKRKKREQKN